MAWWISSPLAINEYTLAYPLILATSSVPESLAEWRARVRSWLLGHRRHGERRGIMTLRDTNGVLLALFYFARRPVGRSRVRLVVPRLRLVEPMGGWQVFHATFQAIEGVARQLGCTEILLQVQPARSAPIEMSFGPDASGERHGESRFARRSPSTPPVECRARSRRR